MPLSLIINFSSRWTWNYSPSAEEYEIGIYRFSIAQNYFFGFVGKFFFAMG